MNLPNLLLPVVIVVLSWAAGKYWFGPSDAKKRAKGIKHDGRRFVYRAAMVAAVCAFFVWRTSWGWLAAVETLLAAGFAMSIGVRTGFNAAVGLDWRYLGSTSADDRWWIRMLAIDDDQWQYHTKWYNKDFCGYAKEVHRAGAIRTLVEALAALILVAAQLWI